MITLEHYRKLAQEHGYRERLSYIAGDLPALHEFLHFKLLTLDLKLHLAKVIICRHFEATGGITLTEDVDWFIGGFREDFYSHLIKPWLTPAVQEAIDSIATHDSFGKVIVGTTFMFGVLELYAKYRLGYRPDGIGLHNQTHHEPFRAMTIKGAFQRLRKMNAPIAVDICAVDKYSIESLREAGIRERDQVRARIEDRLVSARNSMVHGEQHSFYHMGLYTVMLYALFHLHGLRDGTKYEGD